MYTFDQIAEILDDIVDALPEKLLRGLTGIYLNEGTKHNDKIPSNKYYVMGQYIVEPQLGKRIELYYGSIIAVHGGQTLSELCAELHKIVKHELQHHVETLAGCDDLVKQDDEYVRNALETLKQTKERTDAT